MRERRRSDRDAVETTARRDAVSVRNGVHFPNVRSIVEIYGRDL